MKKGDSNSKTPRLNMSMYSGPVEENEEKHLTISIIHNKGMTLTCEYPKLANEYDHYFRQEMNAFEEIVGHRFHTSCDHCSKLFKNLSYRVLFFGDHMKKIIYNELMNE